MAFSANLIIEVNASGATGNGGGFSLTNNANFATDLTTDSNTANTASPVVSSASYNFAAADVGHWLVDFSGTNWTPQWTPIVSVASNKATLDAAVGHAVLIGTVSTAANYLKPNGLNTVAGIATTGTPTSGRWTLDYSQYTVVGVTFTDAVIGADTTTCTSVAHPAGPNWVGNVFNWTSGTGWTVQRAECTNFTTAGLLATFDKSLGTTASTGGNGVMGGCVSTPAVGMGFASVAGNQGYIKATATYTLTSTVTVTAAAKGDTTNGRIVWEGYTSYRGQSDGRPTITSATNSVHLLTFNDNDFWELKHLKLTHTAATRGAAITFVTAASTPFWIKDCVVDGCLTLANAITSNTTLHLTYVEVMNTTSATAAITFNQQVFVYGCDIHDNTAVGLRGSSGTTSTVYNVQETIFDTNTIGIESFSTTDTITLTAHGCVFVDNSSDGIKKAATSGTVTFEFENNIFYGNGGSAINNLDEQAAADANVRINRHNVYGNNGSANVGIANGVGDITTALTADPFVSRSGRDFSLNNNAGGGLVIRGTAFPTRNVSGTTLSYHDPGFSQHSALSVAAVSRARTLIGI